MFPPHKPGSKPPHKGHKPPPHKGGKSNPFQKGGSGSAAAPTSKPKANPSLTDPILGLKNALKAEQVGPLAAQVAKGGGF